MQRRRQDIEFDLRRLLAKLWRKLPVIALCAAIAAACVGAGEYFLVEPVYRSTTKLYVQAKQEGNILNTDMQVNTLLAKDYTELIKTRDVTEQVIDDLGLDMTHEELISRMTVSVPADTRIIELSVTDTDPAKAQRIVQNISSVAAEHIKKVTDTETVNTAAGALFGAVVAALVLTVRFLRDDRIYTSEDIEQVLGISTLGNVPLEKTEKKKRRA